MLSSVMSTAASGLAAQSKRMEANASNVANVDTPGYRRKEVDMVSAGNGVRAVVSEAPAGERVDLSTEIVDALDTKMAYQTNAAAMENGMRMRDVLMNALKPKNRDQR